MPEAVQLALLAAMVLVAGSAAVYGYVRRQRMHKDLHRLLTRDRRLMVTATPCGLGAEDLAGGYDACPRGDRKRGVRYGVSSETTVELLGQPMTLDCAAFQWFYEVEHTTRNSRGWGTWGSSHGSRRKRYEERQVTVAAIQLPVDVWRRILITPESALGRTGLTRGGLQVESDAFNRRFRVESHDRGLAVQLLDASMQELLLEAFTGRSVELRGTTMLLVGDPTHRDESLTGVIGDLPAVRQDVRRLLCEVPAQFWRSTGGE